jgi:glycosyltransferase involved in cell wall biosynthesis
MIDEYKNADVFVMPSIRETSGAVLLEAMSKGLPVVSLNQFGASVLLDEDSAWFFEGETKEDYIKNLSNIIIRCCKNRREIEQKGKNAYQKAEKHVWNFKVDYYSLVCIPGILFGLVAEKRWKVQ